MSPWAHLEKAEPEGFPWLKELLTISTCSLFTPTGNTAENISHAIEHCSSGWKWCGPFNSNILAT